MSKRSNPRAEQLTSRAGAGSGPHHVRAGNRRLRAGETQGGRALRRDRHRGAAEEHGDRSGARRAPSPVRGAHTFLDAELAAPDGVAGDAPAAAIRSAAGRARAQRHGIRALRGEPASVRGRRRAGRAASDGARHSAPHGRAAPALRAEPPGRVSGRALRRGRQGDRCGRVSDRWHPPIAGEPGGWTADEASGCCRDRGDAGERGRPAPSACSFRRSRACPARCTAGAGGRSSSPDRRSSPASARPSRPCARSRTSR